MNENQEIWKNIVGYEGLYEVSNTGKIKSLDRIDPLNHHRKERILKNKLGNKGYYQTVLCKNGICKMFSTHRLVAETFIINENNHPTVNHKDGNKLNNNVKNLEWASHAENTRHAMKMGLTKRVGIDHWKAKLNENDIKEIRRIRKEEKISYRNIAAMFNVSKQNIVSIVKRKRWGHVE